MIVLSLFDGISCGMLALKRAGIPVTTYFASEVDKHSIIVSQKNFPEIVHIGDVRNISYQQGKLYVNNDVVYDGVIDLLIGGSPCQSLSVAGDGTGLDGKSNLFFEYVRLKNEIQPAYWLLENVKMKREWEDILSAELGTNPALINSNIFSAQHRQRNYWTNINIPTLPLIAGPVLKDVLEDGVSPDFYLSCKAVEYMDRETRDGRSHWDFEHHSDTWHEKSRAVVANFYKGVPYNVLIDRRESKCDWYECDFQVSDVCAGCVDHDCYQAKYIPTKVVRHFTPTECERLQTLPDGYTEGVAKTHRYKMIGNGWTVDVIAHIFKGMLPK